MGLKKILDIFEKILIFLTNFLDIFQNIFWIFLFMKLVTVQAIGMILYGIFWFFRTDSFLRVHRNQVFRCFSLTFLIFSWFFPMFADLGRFLACLWLDGLHWHELTRLRLAWLDHTQQGEQKVHLYTQQQKQHKGGARLRAPPLCCLGALARPCCCV